MFNFFFFFSNIECSFLCLNFKFANKQLLVYDVTIQISANNKLFQFPEETNIFTKNAGQKSNLPRLEL